jgi:hypothetical protein
LESRNCKGKDENRRRGEIARAKMSTLFVTVLLFFRSWEPKLRVTRRLIPSGSLVFLLQIDGDSGIRTWNARKEESRG